MEIKELVWWCFKNGQNERVRTILSVTFPILQINVTNWDIDL